MKIYAYLQLIKTCRVLFVLFCERLATVLMFTAANLIDDRTSQRYNLRKAGCFAKRLTYRAVVCLSLQSGEDLFSLFRFDVCLKQTNKKTQLIIEVQKRIITEYLNRAIHYYMAFLLPLALHILFYSILDTACIREAWGRS